MRPLVIVFAKAPKPGAVKTRLTGVLSPEYACDLHSAMVLDFLERLTALRDEADVELHTDRPTSEWNIPGVRAGLQSDGDLGRRLYAAIDSGLLQGRPAVLVLGSDSPTVPLDFVRALLADSADVALGPAADGGYYAILCRRAHAEMFDGVTWSSPTTLKETVRAAERCGLAVSLGPEWYDIDSPEDLERLRYDPELGPATRAVMESSGHW